MPNEDLESMTDPELSGLSMVFDERGQAARKILQSRRDKKHPSRIPRVAIVKTDKSRARKTRSAVAPSGSFLTTIVLVVGVFLSRISKSISKIQFPKFKKNGDLSMTKAKKAVSWVVGILVFLGLSALGAKMIYDKGQRDAEVVVSSEDLVANYDPATVVKVDVGYSKGFDLPVGTRWKTKYFLVAPDTEFAATASGNGRIDVGWYNPTTDEILWKRNVYWVELKKLPVAGDIIILRPHEQKPCTINVFGSKLR